MSFTALHPKSVWVHSMWYSQEELTIHQGQVEATLKELQSLRNMQKDAIGAYKVRSMVEGLWHRTGIHSPCNFSYVGGKVPRHIPSTH